MRAVQIDTTFDSWRSAARDLLRQRIPPESVLWSDQPQEPSLFAEVEDHEAPRTAPVPPVPADFLELARSVSAHSDAQRWSLLYRILWRLTHGGERKLLAIPTDSDIRQAQLWRKAVSRAIHKMHAFVRFRLVGIDEASGREQFAAWFEPEYRIVRLAAPFFQKRFAAMDWSILTPSECAHWDGSQLRFSPGLPPSAAPSDDALEALWRTYYRSIFNPSRLKVNAMQSEMPKKYWKNLPEAALIETLIEESGDRMQDMLQAEGRPAKPAPSNGYLRSLRQKGP